MKKIAFALINLITIFGIYYYCKHSYTPYLPHGFADDILVVGTSADYPPYEKVDLNTGEIVGFEVDIIKEIAKRLNKKIILKDMPFNSLILELMAGHIDCIAAALSPTPQRKKAVLFSHPYLDNDELIIITHKETSPITKISDLYGKTVAVNIGYTSDKFLSEYPEISLLRLKSPADGILALQTYSADAFVTAQSNFEIFANNQAKHNYKISKIADSADTYALAFEKNNKILQNKINTIIDEMMHDGTIQNIKHKWGFA